MFSNNNIIRITIIAIISIIIISSSSAFVKQIRIPPLVCPGLGIVTSCFVAGLAFQSEQTVY